jgi:hypothetical protein
MEFKWRVKFMLEKFKLFSLKKAKAEFEALKQFSFKKDTMILQAGKGNCTVIMDESNTTSAHKKD